MSRVQEIFAAAVDISDQIERDALLDRECGDSPTLRAQIADLLEVRSQAEEFFSDCRADDPTPVVDTDVLETSSETNDKNIGLRIGPYKLLQKIGEGGCGGVYMAEQEKPVRRRVALKIIKLGMDSRNVIARFESERQALAMMDHPNIARVLDAGTTEAGRPFFVMELIHGVNILEFCDKNNLPARQRLELFIHVCNAIQHAHQKGIVHRDIKPSNILVTSHDGLPVPKVIDFGIAKAMTEPLTDKTLFTRYGFFMGTPAYMSPEQAEHTGLDVDTRSDIYSLGVLLYELLTGKPPFDQHDLMLSGLDEMRRTLRECEPYRPSAKLKTYSTEELTATAARRHIEPSKLQSLLKGDLDWIVMKSLEKDRRRRYETANGLAMDVGRFLNNEPIVARPPSRGYRLQKLVQRNRIVFSAAGIVTLVVLAWVGTSTRLLLRERQQRNLAVEAERQAEKARQNEAILRHEADSRAAIDRAAVMIADGKLQEAEKLVRHLELPVIEPSLEASDVFRRLGDWAASEGRWSEAAVQFQRLNLAFQLDKSETTDLSAVALLRLGPTLIAAGDVPAYHQFVDNSITRFSDISNAMASEQVMKACLICPPNASNIEKLRPLSDVLSKSIGEAGLGLDPNLVAWREFALALYDYRCGNYKDTIVLLQKCMASQNYLPERTAMAHFVLGMAFYQIKNVEPANSELSLGQALIRQYCPNAQGNISISGMAPGTSLYWYDWVTAQILQREADAMIQR
ncbi:MAG TPA: serine/threonine-protein kinase [Candidatus Acidoferrales bacterium]|jgi:serine/threonine protein kinase|nr:serine/threonine-protein kinase [Candidatus Acidoferrales bacterium]